MSETVEAIARSVVDDGVAPAVAVALAVRVGDRWIRRSAAAGRPNSRPSGPLSRCTPFDLASISKSFVATTAARLVRAGALHWDLDLGSVLQETLGTPTAQATLECVLAHRAGLEPHRPLYRPLLERRAFHAGRALTEAARAVWIGPDERPGPCRPRYSDLGYLLLGEAIARRTGQPLDRLIWQQVCSPLGLQVGSSRQWLHWDPSFQRNVAPTEVVPWRGGVLAGVVHDENAWAYAGHAAAGHAGLFGSAEAVAKFAAAVLDVMAGRRNDWLDAATLAHLVATRPGGTLRAGFDGVASGASAAGKLCGPHTFGHLGFTGTSFWCDPAAACATVLLTNRVNLGRHHLAIREARPRVHDRLYRLAQEIRTEG